MAAFGKFCPEIIWDKSQFKVPTSKKSEKSKSPSLQLLKLT